MKNYRKFKRSIALPILALTALAAAPVWAGGKKDGFDFDLVRSLSAGCLS
jgi:hypothetical protein